MSEHIEIDLTGYESGIRDGYWYHHRRDERPVRCYKLYERDQGLRAARDSQLSKKAGDAASITLIVPQRVSGTDESFLKAFLGPTARKLGPDVLKAKLNVRGGTNGVGSEIIYFLEEEKARIEARAKEAGKAPKDEAWSHTQPLFVPDIGTRMRLNIPWTFTLTAESRNMGLIRALRGEKKQGWSFGEWDEDDGSGRRRGYRRSEITLKEGAVLIVDRVYIRQGKGFEDFSSLTFRLEKGATFVYNGNDVTLKTKPRFWAKLRDVNNLLVEVDMNSLPGQEREGTARKD